MKSGQDLADADDGLNSGINDSAYLITNEEWDLTLPTV